MISNCIKLLFIIYRRNDIKTNVLFHNLSQNLWTEKKGAQYPSLLSCVLSPPFILSPICCLGKDEKGKHKSSPTLFSSVEGLTILSALLLNLFCLQFFFVLHLPFTHFVHLNISIHLYTSMHLYTSIYIIHLYTFIYIYTSIYIYVPLYIYIHV